MRYAEPLKVPKYRLVRIDEVLFERRYIYRMRRATMKSEVILYTTSASIPKLYEASYPFLGIYSRVE